MPTCIMMPAEKLPSPSSMGSHSNSSSTANDVEPRHFITPRDFALWSKQHASIRPEGQPYRAPQHPTSHLLHSIPPRSAARSSRSNILSYTLHLSTTSRLTTYTSSSGGAVLLTRAESGGSVRKSETDEWAEEEEKSRGLRKLSLSLLSASRLEGPLPPTVERRVILARLTEDLLVSPLPPTVFVPTSTTSTAVSTPALAIKVLSRPSAEVQSLIALAPLTSPDTTTTYSPAISAARAASSIAQSLIELKFGNSRDAERVTALSGSSESQKSDLSSSYPPMSAVPHHLLPSSSSLDSSVTSSIPASSVFGQGSPSVPSHAGGSNGGQPRRIVEAPHMDYRIVRGQEMRSRAKEIFSVSILSNPATSTTSARSEWCRRHRVNACGICSPVSTINDSISSSTAVSTTAGASTSIQATKKRVTSFPGQGLVGVLTPTGARRPLAEIIPTFLIFSATLLFDLQERSTAASAAENDASVTAQTQPSMPSVAVTPSWYSLLHSLTIQACLEGYLVDGWTGTEAIEVLFGCGCGVWEGRGWASRAAMSVACVASPTRRRQQRQKSRADVAKAGAGVVSNEDDESSGSDTDSEEEEAAKLERAKEVEKRELVEAAQLLFGSRDQAQAEFERNMRDRIHEFLNVPQDQTLHTHLLTLNAKYPLSGFEADVVDFLDSTSRFLGKPSLARYEPTVTPVGQVPSPASTGAADAYALSRFFARSMEPEEPTESDSASFTSMMNRMRASSNVIGPIKRRRMD